MSVSAPDEVVLGTLSRIALRGPAVRGATRRACSDWLERRGPARRRIGRGPAAPPGPRATPLGPHPGSWGPPRLGCPDSAGYSEAMAPIPPARHLLRARGGIGGRYRDAVV